MTCSWCRTSVIPDIPGLSPVMFQFYEGEGFVLHEKCAENLVAQMNALKTEKGKEKFVKMVLKKLSNGGGV